MGVQREQKVSGKESGTTIFQILKDYSIPFLQYSSEPTPYTQQKLHKTYQNHSQSHSAFFLSIISCDFITNPSKISQNCRLIVFKKLCNTKSIKTNSPSTHLNKLNCIVSNQWKNMKGCGTKHLNSIFFKLEAWHTDSKK